MLEASCNVAAEDTWNILMVMWWMTKIDKRISNKVLLKPKQALIEKKTDASWFYRRTLSRPDVGGCWEEKLLRRRKFGLFQCARPWTQVGSRIQKHYLKEISLSKWNANSCLPNSLKRRIRTRRLLNIDPSKKQSSIALLLPTTTNSIWTPQWRGRETGTVLITGPNYCSLEIFFLQTYLSLADDPGHWIPWYTRCRHVIAKNSICAYAFYFGADPRDHNFPMIRFLDIQEFRFSCAIYALHFLIWLSVRSPSCTFIQTTI